MNKASGGDRIPVELFKILKKDDAVKALHSMSANLENSAVAAGLEKVSFHSNRKEGQCQRMFKLRARVSFPPAFGARVPSRPRPGLHTQYTLFWTLRENLGLEL